MKYSGEARQCAHAAAEIKTVSAVDVLSPLRGPAPVAFARQVAMWLYYNWKGKSNWSELGRQFGRDRTTARHAVELVSKRMNEDERGLGKDVRGALKSLRSR